MKNIESQILKSLKEISTNIKGNPFLIQLISKGQKFEGWVQIELAQRLVDMDPENQNKVFCERRVDRGNSFADISLIKPGKENIYIEIKFLVMGRAITDSRNSLIKQMKDNSKSGISYGVAFFVSAKGEDWYKEERNQIFDNKDIFLVDEVSNAPAFSIALFKHS